MKKLILAFVACMFSLTAYAQNFYVNAGYEFADEGSYDGDGLYASFGYTFLSNAKMSHAAEVQISSLDMDLDNVTGEFDYTTDVLVGMINYRFTYNLADRINAFALAGLGMMDSEMDILGDSDTSFAAQVGLGVELMANDTFGVQLSYTYIEVGDCDWGVPAGSEIIVPEFGGGIDSYKAGVVFYF